MTTPRLPSRRRAALAGAVAALAVLVAGCTGGGPSRKETPVASYTPVPDQALFDRVRALPGVDDARVSFRDNLTDGALYSGALVGDGKDNPYAVLDAAVAVLRQGRPGAHILLTLDVPPAGGGNPVQYLSTGLLDRTKPDPLTARYGPQPGTGEPPTNTPVPTPSGWTPAP